MAMPNRGLFVLLIILALTESLEAYANQNPLLMMNGNLLRSGANVLSNKGELFKSRSRQLYDLANRINPRPVRQPSPPPNNQFVVNGQHPPHVENPEEFNFGRLQDLLKQQQKLILIRQQLEALKEIEVGTPQIQQSIRTIPGLRLTAAESTCDTRMSQLVNDIFVGHEVVPQILESPPDHPLELTFKTQRTFPGMKLTADATRSKPILNWPTQPNTLYTVIMSNLDINSRTNRSLSEFYHWLVANVPGTNVDEGEEIFQLLSPLVLPEGGGDHRFAYFVLKQPGKIDYKAEGGPTSNCSPTMANGRGPKRSTKDFIRKYKLEVTAATFLIIDPNDTSIELACEWQHCMGGEVFLEDLDCGQFTSRKK